MPCVFCQIIRGESPAAIVYQDDWTVAFMDIRPASHGHLLIVPKKHYTYITEMPPDEVGHLFKVTSKIARALVKALNPKGFHILQNNGAEAGQVIPHVHVHIVPRYGGESLLSLFTQRKMQSIDQLQIIAQAIKDKIEG